MNLEIENPEAFEKLMAEPAPTNRTTDRDGEGPVKRHRRPALSCVECRMRKVKCDRQKPCAPCTRIRSATCTYRSKRDQRLGRSPAGLSASSSNDRDQDISISSRSSAQITGTSKNELDLLVNRYVAPGIFGEHGRAEMQPLPSSRPTFNLGSDLQSGESSVIQSLLERIRNLEERGAAKGVNDDSSSLPIREESGTSQGQFLKAKYYGQSHWVNALEPYDALGEANTVVNPNTNRKEVNKKTELFATVGNIKKMARIIKASRLLQPSMPQEVQESIPSKELCDALVECYFRVFEGAFRVLHAPTFRQEYEAYWAGTETGKLSVVLKILLVCAIGTPFYTGPEQAALRAAAAKWIQAATSWLNGTHIKSKLNMAGLQISILTLLARQVCNADGDFIWILSGLLLRTAMHLGLHRDPAHFSKISPFHREMRRRLWATTLEIIVQSSLDMGMPPMISVNDYDTKPPSNINDEDIGEGKDAPFNEKTPNEFTDSSIQIAFTRTLPVRLEIIRLINNLRFDLPYDVVLKIGKELIDACDEQTMFFKTALNSGYAITPCSIKLADSLVRRFVLCLHRPYFGKARENPQYHFSRKICLDTSLAILAPATILQSGQEDDWRRMSYRCVGFFKSFALYAMSTVYLELSSQIDEQQQTSTILAPLVSNNNTPINQPIALPAQFHVLREVLVRSHETTLARLRNGETNAKGVTFLACALARIDALVSGVNPDIAVLKAAKESVANSSRILAEVYEAEHGEPINLQRFNPNKDAERGDGADDITGHYLRTGTAVPDDIDPGFTVDGSISISQDFSNTHGGLDGFDMLNNGLGGVSGNTEFDFNAYLRGQPMEMSKNEFHFARSPEWFYDMSGWAAAGGFSHDFSHDFSGT